MDETLGFIWRDHFPPLFSPAEIWNPFPGAERAPEHTCATPQPDTRVCDRYHAHGNRTRTCSDHTSRQFVTG